MVFADSLIGVTACDQLRCMVRAMGGYAMPTQIVAQPADLEPDRPEFSILLKRMMRLSDELLAFVGSKTEPFGNEGVTDS